MRLALLAYGETLLSELPEPEGFEKRLQEQSKKLDEWQRLIDEKLKRI